MKRLAALAAFVCLTAPVHSTGLVTFLSGNDYRQMNEITRAYMVMGSLDQIKIGLYATNPPLFERVARCTDSMTAGQLRAILDAWLSAHPEKWDSPFASLFYVSMVDACEKRGTPLSLTK